MKSKFIHYMRYNKNQQHKKMVGTVIWSMFVRKNFEGITFTFYLHTYMKLDFLALVFFSNLRKNK